MSANDEERMAIYDQWSNGEIVAQVAPITGKEPEELEHVVVIWLTKEGYLGGRSTECQLHANMLCQLAAERLFVPIQLDLGHILAKGHDKNDPHIH